MVFSSSPDFRSCSMTAPTLSSMFASMAAKMRRWMILDVGELFHVGVRSLERAVDRVVGEVEKERFVVVTIDEVDRFASEGVGEVFGFLHRLAAADDGVVGIVVGFVAEKVVEMEFFLSDQYLLGRPPGSVLRRSRVSHHPRAGERNSGLRA